MHLAHSDVRGMSVIVSVAEREREKYRTWRLLCDEQERHTVHASEFFRRGADHIVSHKMNTSIIKT